MKKKQTYFTPSPQLQASHRYSATLGHKINHSFRPNCVWATALHPCYGRVPAVKTLVAVAARDELLVDYMMDPQPDWYWRVWEEANSNITAEDVDQNDDTVEFSQL